MAPSEQLDQPHEKWISYYARFGYAAKGIVYGSSGILATLAAFDLGDNDTVGSTGALSKIAEQPFGRVLLAAITVSLMGYVLWRFIQAALDPEYTGRDFSDIVRRLSYAYSGFAYIGVAFSAVKVLTYATEGESKTPADWAFEIMQQPFGRWLVMGGGLLFSGIGFYYFYRAIKAKFRQQFKLHKMSDVAKTWAVLLGRIGIAARGVVYVVIGFYGVKAGWEFNPDMIKTTEDALAVFSSNPTDEIILGTLGIGFIAYGAHMLFQARYRGIDPLVDQYSPHT